MATPPDTSAKPALGGSPVIPTSEAWSRVSRATRYVERMDRSRTPRQRRGSPDGVNPGVYGFLAAGATISGASGLTLGTGTVTLCSRTGATCVANGDSVTVYNAGGSLSGGASGLLLALGWVDGDWSVEVAPC